MTDPAATPTGETPASDGDSGDSGDTKPLELPEEPAGATPGYTVPPADEERGVEGVAEEPDS